ncbi:MAG: hypothetical protein WCH98_14635 [Verrucomicrobiota bacterium]
MKSSFLKVAICSVLASAAWQTLCADPAEAEDTAYRMAKRYIDKGFAMAPTDHSGVTGAGSAIEFLIPVNKGLDYTFLVGTDKAALDVDIYVYDDVGGLILDDRRPGRLAGVQFRSPYNGTAKVYMHMASAVGLASWYVLVGRRGTIRPDSPAPYSAPPVASGGSGGAPSPAKPAPSASPDPVGP